MSSYILSLILIFSLFIIVKKVIRRFSLHFLESVGFEFIFLGFLLNPYFIDSTIYVNLKLFEPILILCIALTGLRLGMDLRFTDFGKVSTISFKIAFFDLFITFSILCAVLIVGLIYLLNIRSLSYDLILFVVSMSVIGVSSSKTISKLVATEKKISEQLRDIVQHAIEFHQTATVLIFGLIFTTLPLFSSIAVYDFESISTIWIGLLLAILIGFILQLVFESESSMNPLFIFLAALICSSVAFFYNLSPILTALICGIVLNNVSSKRLTIKKELDNTAHIATSLIVLYACMTVQFSHPLISIFLLLIYIIVRYFGKVISQKIAYFFIKTDQRVTDKFSAIFVSQGRLALVLLVSFQLIYKSDWLDVIQLTVIIAVLINQFIGYQSYRNFVIDYDLKIKDTLNI